MFNVHWMSKERLEKLLLGKKLYSCGVFSEERHENGFKLIVSNKDFEFGLKNKNLWVKSIEDVK